jgi:dienelactone hydrolase
MRSVSISIALSVCATMLLACPAAGEKQENTAIARSQGGQDDSTQRSGVQPGDASQGSAAQNGTVEQGGAAMQGQREPQHGPAPKGAEFNWLTTTDGMQVASWYWPPKSSGAPAVILLHQRGKDKSSWGSVPDKLLAEGYAAIAIDLRGHGETVDANGRRLALDALQDRDYQAMMNDVAAAQAFLEKQKDVDSEHLAIFGASIGANLAIMYTAGNRNVRGAVALSPGLNYRSLKPADYLDAYSTRPLYLIASTGDTQSYQDSLELEKLAVKAKPVHTRYFEKSNAHGTDILRAQDGLDDTLISGFLLNYLPPKR